MLADQQDELLHFCYFDLWPKVRTSILPSPENCAFGLAKSAITARREFHVNNEEQKCHEPGFLGMLQKHFYVVHSGMIAVHNIRQDALSHHDDPMSHHPTRSETGYISAMSCLSAALKCTHVIHDKNKDSYDS
jgi:hypothetical protein